MFENGDSEAILNYLMDNYKSTINKLGLEIKIADSPLEKFEVTKYPDSFMKFMTNQGYSNRQKFQSYSACDVLSYIVMAENRLFEDYELNFEINTLIGETILVKEYLGVSSCESLYNKIRPLIEDKPVILDFQGVQTVEDEFLLNNIGKLCFELNDSLLSKNLILINARRSGIFNQAIKIKRSISEIKKPEIQLAAKRFLKGSDL